MYLVLPFTCGGKTLPYGHEQRLKAGIVYLHGHMAMVAWSMPVVVTWVAFTWVPVLVCTLHLPSWCMLNWWAQEGSESKRAVITTETGNMSALSMTLQLIPGAMPTVMLAAYCDGIIQWYDS